MIASLRSELVKLRQPAYWIGLAGMAAFMVIAMVISVSGAGDEASDRGPAGVVLSADQLAEADGLARSLGNSITFIGVVALTLVAVNIGTEYGQGTIRNMLVRQPHRARLFLGKLAAILGFLAAAVVAASAVGIAVAPVLVPDDVGAVDWWSASGLLATAGGVGNIIVATWGWACLGVLLAVVLRSAPATIGVGVAYALPFEILLTVAAEDVTRWLPGQLFQALAQGGTEAVSRAAALLGAVGWVAATVVVALIIFQRRDVPD
ncbi:ABC transporter permease subunit [Phytoactinopolyspora mesophila]|uniref:ABC transporter permease subunit n=1 Tax=Phytoactinopolyspora mesophila TaxID=2650750 RepID=A0A7K3M2G7_9ACTN|nr:ABC transporter permease subunit [Phytoactinopolyspora mesophila]NDL57112.1 ABC transporter permease subunit [Phytoactinopolyspora mesophila]